MLVNYVFLQPSYMISHVVWSSEKRADFKSNEIDANSNSYFLIL